MHSRQTDLSAAVREASEASGYESAVQILLDAGIRLFGLEMPSRTVYYNSDNEAYVDRVEPYWEAEPAEAMLDAEAVHAAMLATQTGGLDRAGFLRRLWHAGVTEYYMNLLVGTVTYRGRNGETLRGAVSDGEVARMLMPRG
ncbi:MAG TPA: hypothetical protein VFY10_06165 [Dehalococcoidia bacterium]|jgi:uncharacterized protein YbcV (DUF1398 family)|nr:hypothetical protein [Dehalococcoidia bacterium]